MKRTVFSIRGAYNWRAPFLAATFGAQSQPTQVFAYDQIDLSASAKLNDSISVFAEVLNLTDNRYQDYSRFEERRITVSTQGRRIGAGMRFNF
ncbi:TonB-dependent receptor [Sphingomonas sp. SORGH_AS_0879]|uniref:TonB-dependent receptor n=1 Tax=Sphingomonas sp. SORGH_AS_0879 TaxID=3041790 RepID=UPI0027866C0A|nr:TonB-dependent receptor [Sphingomonas sp. SORGH_AS_0879]MDQ1231881.1 outer membrane receptor protein involved in Fe transport [Sphingomonas sp. SORGH_AS_0879]